MSTKNAIEVAKSVLWAGPRQGAIFVCRVGQNITMAHQHELSGLRSLAIQFPNYEIGTDIVEAIVVPGEMEGDCIVF